MPTHAEQIRTLNDAFRRSFEGGRIVQTPHVSALPTADQAVLCRLVRDFDRFDADNDPHDEHDYGQIEHAGASYAWKIDYYDAAMEFGSPNPANPSVSTRVLTLMHVDEA